jgi:hypothetical protein
VLHLEPVVHRGEQADSRLVGRDRRVTNRRAQGRRAARMAEIHEVDAKLHLCSPYLYLSRVHLHCLLEAASASPRGRDCRRQDGRRPWCSLRVRGLHRGLLAPALKVARTATDREISIYL